MQKRLVCLFAVGLIVNSAGAQPPPQPVSPQPSSVSSLNKNLPPPKPGYKWVTCKDPFFADRLPCNEGEPKPASIQVRQEEWQKVSDKRACGPAIVKCYKKTQASAIDACLANLPDLCSGE